MGQVRWAGWTIAIATVLVIGGQAARADITSDKPAAIVIYPKVAVDFKSGKGVDTVIRLTNTNTSTPIQVHCFYLDANSHCSGGVTKEGDICLDSSECGIGGICLPGWQEIDFHLQLTPGQPIEWKASDGLSDERHCDAMTGDEAGKVCKIAEDCPTSKCVLGLPLIGGVCVRNPLRSCSSDADCNPFPGGACTQSNAGTRIPGVPEDPFVGELKCIAIDANGVPVPRNDLKGEAILEKSTAADLDVASYNALGIQATGRVTEPSDVLTLGGDDAEYNGCPNYLILNHFFDRAVDPVPDGLNGGATKLSNEITTNLVLVPCSEDLLRQIPGEAVIQYLIFNEFEQRFSTSKSVRCFQDIRLCNLDTRDCSRSVFNVGVAGTLAGQTRINAIAPPRSPLPSAVLGIAVEYHNVPDAKPTTTPTRVRSAAFNLHMQGARSAADTITIP